MIVALTEEELEYLRDRPFWDWQQEEIKLKYFEIGLLVGNQKLEDIKSINKKIKFYHNLYKKLSGDEEE